jgi:hypothetical protein
MKITTSNSSGTIVNNSGWAATSTNTAYNPNIGNTFIYQTTPTPFNIRFSWDDKEVDISLKDGNDIFKLANKFMKWLDMNKIEYNVKTKNKRKKK